MKTLKSPFKINWPLDEREIQKGVDETHLRILYMASTTNPARKKRDVDINVRVSDILQDVMWKGKFMWKNL